VLRIARASNRACASTVHGWRAIACSIVGPTARSITMSEPVTSNTSGTGTPNARACTMTEASRATALASRPSRYRRSTRPPPMS
jgi:hypothetical protein